MLEIQSGAPKNYRTVAPSGSCTNASIRTKSWKTVMTTAAERRDVARSNARLMATRARKNLYEKIEALREKRGRYGAILADLE